MFYSTVKVLLRAGLSLYFRRIRFTVPEALNSKGPLLLASNHPNSFMDAIIIGSHFKRPVHFLARGDVFRKPLARWFLRRLQMIPIYRLSEGREYLTLNDATFRLCGNILEQGGVILIFAEGLCVHEWSLRPLRKGAAKIALSGWANPLIAGKLRVFPVSINYSDFNRIGKQVIISFGTPVIKVDIPEKQAEGQQQIAFNQILSSRIADGLLISEQDNDLLPFLINNASTKRATLYHLPGELRQQKATISHQHLQAAVQKLTKDKMLPRNFSALLLNCFAAVFLFPAAIIGWFCHAPLYWPMRRFVFRKTEGTVFYDSVLFGILVLSYPLYWAIINLTALLLLPPMACFALLLLPLWAKIYLLHGASIQCVVNYFRLSAAQRRALNTALRS